jgi:HEAT repeat protein
MGTLYVADMYRETIEHPWSLPPGIKKFLDLNSGNDRGRIYRIVPEGFKQPPAPARVRLGAMSTEQLVGVLEHPNGWHRETASRLLFERQDQSAVEPLRKLMSESKVAVGRLHAMRALDGLGALKAEDVTAAMGIRMRRFASMRCGWRRIHPAGSVADKLAEVRRGR